MASGTLISDRNWHSYTPTFHYSVNYETQRPNIYSTIVRVRFIVTVRSIYSNCVFRYPIYFSNTIDNQFRTITNDFGSGIKSVSYTSDWIQFNHSGTSMAVGITPKCGDEGHTSYDTGTIYFDAYVVPQAKITSFSVENIAGSDGLTKVKFNWSADSTIDYTWYSIDGGSTWNNLASTNIVSGLIPNTSYNFKLRVRRKESQLTTDSGIVTKSTYDIARIKSINNFEHGNSATAIITNPAEIEKLSLVMKVGGTQILSKTVKSGSNTIIFSDTQLDNIYKKYGKNSILTATFIVSGGEYTNSKTCTITLKGNQKTLKNNINNSWKRGKIWLKVNDVWKRAVIWTKVNEEWRRGI